MDAMISPTAVFFEMFTRSITETTNTLKTFIKNETLRRRRVELAISKNSKMAKSIRSNAFKLKKMEDRMKKLVDVVDSLNNQNKQLKTLNRGMLEVMIRDEKRSQENRLHFENIISRNEQQMTVLTARIHFLEHGT
jgi:hypothetical protein